MRRRVVVTGVTCVALGSACSSSASPAATIAAPPSVTVTPSAAGSGSPSSTPVLSGPCANDYFPVVHGATRDYQLHEGAATARGRQTIIDIGGAGFTTLLLSPQGGQRDVWTCERTGLADVQTYSVTASGSPTPGVVVFHGFRSVGVTVPKHLYVGAAWTQTVTSHGDFPVLGVDHPETQVVRSNYQVVGEGSISTPAGALHGLKVEITVTTDKRSRSLGMHTISVTHVVEWVARGVGVVEATSKRPGFSSTLRLLAYHIP